MKNTETIHELFSYTDMIQIYFQVICKPLLLLFFLNVGSSSVLTTVYESADTMWIK